MKKAVIINGVVDAVYLSDAPPAAVDVPDTVFGGFIQNADGTFSAPSDPAPTLAEAQAAQTAALYAACSKTITGGFQSSALGAVHTYPSKVTDQINLIGLDQAGTGGDFWCAGANGVWAYVSHTAAQISQVFQDGVAARLACSTKLKGLVAQVQAATSVAAVQAVAW